jgi:hypothetical protein
VSDIGNGIGSGQAAVGWWTDRREVVAFARALVEADQLGETAYSITSMSRAGGPADTKSGARRVVLKARDTRDSPSW